MEEFSISKRFFVPMLIALGRFDETKTLLTRNWRNPREQIVLATL